jgi:uncharacterized membrane protein
MKRYFENLARALLGQSYKSLDDVERRVIDSIVEHKTVSENVNNSFNDSLSMGQRTADSVAAFGGSWTFIGLFFVVIVLWMFVNSHFLLGAGAFDPYPFILLNLVLSTLAAFQAPIIMMSQNRQAAKDRVKQEAAYEINLKLELQIMRLHEKLDQISVAGRSKGDSADS